MNEFDKLSAEELVSRLAQVQSHELPGEQPAIFETSEELIKTVKQRAAKFVQDNKGWWTHMFFDDAVKVVETTMLLGASIAFEIAANEDKIS